MPKFSVDSLLSVLTQQTLSNQLFYVSVLILLTMIIFHFARLVISITHLFFDKNFSKLNVKIKNEFTAKGLNKMPLSIDEVQWYVDQVFDLCPSSLHGIEEVVLCDRDLLMDDRVLASFCPDGSENGKGIVRLYPLPYNKHLKMFTPRFNDTGSVKLGFTDEEAKIVHFFSLGHEIGHNVMYKKKKLLHGREIEMACDSFSEELQIVKNPHKNCGRVINENLMGKAFN